MPRSKPCPRDCGNLAEVKTYVTTSGEPLVVGPLPGSLSPAPAVGPNNLTNIDVWECSCGWAEDVEP